MGFITSAKSGVSSEVDSAASSVSSSDIALRMALFQRWLFFDYGLWLGIEFFLGHGGLILE
ncbi:MAG: hypothetical protein Ct9H90mP16_06730 [Candidatus Poseidoniales archaeon]|nr:MAG: hypothetical protein Ct9H90mP16_06730 [Candidatus Poseidoniales archaeon]